ncbi:MAG TPA: hypothetical protein VK749_26495 [Xanthobacteraceae bacterium]|nr:hypothetical protein [Xanthobacteraceae bacterium]
MWKKGRQLQLEERQILSETSVAAPPWWDDQSFSAGTGNAIPAAPINAGMDKGERANATQNPEIAQESKQEGKAAGKSRQEAATARVNGFAQESIRREESFRGRAQSGRPASGSADGPRAHDRIAVRLPSGAQTFDFGFAGADGIDGISRQDCQLYGGPEDGFKRADSGATRRHA